MKYSIFFLSFSSAIFGAATSDSRIQFVIDDGSSVFSIDAGAEDSLAKKTYQEIIKRNFESDSGTLLALAQTKDGERQIYDAFTLNERIFGAEIPDLNAQGVVDPVTQKPVADIRYFLLHSPEDKVAFNVGSISGMKSSLDRAEFVKAMINANDSRIPLAKRIPAFFEIGNRYEQGKGVRSKDGKQALYWFNKALHQEIDKRAQAKANYRIGILYENGIGSLPKDLNLARLYFEKAIDQKASVGSKEYSLYRLANLDEQEGHISRARARLNSLVRYATIDEVKTRARNKLADINKRMEVIEPSLHPAATLAEVPYQVLRDQKRQVFVDYSKASEELAEDQNTQPRIDFQ